MDSSTLLLWLSGALFSLGLLGVIVRRNALVMLMCMELMLNGVNLSLVTFSQQRGDTAHAGACNSNQVDLLWRWRSERLAQLGGCHLTPSLTARSMTSATFFAADSGVSFFAAAAIVARRVGSFRRFEILAAKTSGTISFSSTITDAPALT